MMDSPEVDFGNCLPFSIASLRAGLSTGLSYRRAGCRCAPAEILRAFLK